MSTAAHDIIGVELKINRHANLDKITFYSVKLMN